MVKAGTIIDGRYKVLSRIGSGGMADVYLARDQLLGREMAVKVLQHRFAQDQEFVERFRREASSAAGLSHPNVVQIFDRGEWDGTYYIAMEFLPGRTLKAIVREQGPLDPAAAIDVVIQILRAAKFAHARGIIHRDLKPHNVILDEEGRAKVTDFGIARAGASDMTLTGSIMGTAQYLSPEQAQGQAVSESSDIYAVGIVLYELLTGSVPFDGETAVTIALKHVSAEPPPPSALNPAVPPALDAVVLRALAKDPVGRFATAEEFIAALEEARRGVLPTERANGVQAPATGSLLLPAAADDGEDAEAANRRRRWIWAAALMALLIASGVAAALLLGSSGGVRVPDVRGQSESLALARMRAAGLKPVSSPAASSTVAAGAVIAQSPKPGDVVDRGARVSLVVSSGPGSVAMPEVVGLTQARAVGRLRAEGLAPTTRTQASAKVPAGTVISTDPTAGTELQSGSAVTLVVSGGPTQVQVPDLTGETQAEAKDALSAAGLKLGTLTHQDSTSATPGTVISQSPAAGATLQGGQAVGVVLARAPKEVNVPEVVGQSQVKAAGALGGAGFAPKSVSRATTDPTKVGIVLAQSPAGGRAAPRGSTVTIAVGTLATPPPSTQTTTTPTTPPTTTTPAVAPAASGGEAKP